MKQDNELILAGVWSRLAAFLIDCAIAKAISLGITRLIVVLSLALLHIEGVTYPALVGAYSYIVVSVLYFTLLDSSVYQATLGKMLFRIQAIDINRHRLSFGKALMKYLIMWLLPVFFVGNYIIPAILVMGSPILFTPNKQGIYDMFTGCLVVEKDVLD